MSMERGLGVDRGYCSRVSFEGIDRHSTADAIKVSSSTDDRECSTKRKFKDMSKINSENHVNIVPDVPWQMPVVMDTSSMAMSPV